MWSFTNDEVVPESFVFIGTSTMSQQLVSATFLTYALTKLTNVSGTLGVAPSTSPKMLQLYLLVGKSMSKIENIT